VNLKGDFIVLVKPPIHIGTKEAYAGVKPRRPENSISDILSDKAMWKGSLHNDFEDSIFPKYPELATIKQRMYDSGAYYAAMSGSGSTVFGLFTQAPPEMKWADGYFVFEAGF
jgi:4-diphosphocytidyl-2-C-methyl-D-erythritol kinase